jgi:hypothetical protein
MHLSNEQLELATQVLLAMPPGANPLQEMRRELAGVPVIRCDAEDMSGESPFRRLPGIDLFLVDTDSHCWRLVGTPGEASGLIVVTCK